MIFPAVERAVRDFRAWAKGDDGDGPGACIRCLGALLEGRADYLGRKDPTRWRRGEVRALLYDLAVPRLNEQCDLIAHAVPVVDAFLDFLDRTDRLHPGSAPARHLRQELAHHAAGFPEAMADPSRFRMAKTLYQAMLADGIDLVDDQAVNDWTARFNRASRAERAAVLEHLLRDQPGLLTAEFVAREGKVIALEPGQGPFDSRMLLPPERRVPDVMPAFAPVAVPSRAEAVTAARGTPLLTDMLALARWIGQGRKATRDGEPVPADVRALAGLLGYSLPGVKVSHLHQIPSVETLFWLARQLELVDLRRTGLVAGPALATWQGDDALATAADTDVLDLWQETFALIEFGRQVPEEAAGKSADSVTFYETSRGQLPVMMLTLYRSAALDQDESVPDLVEPRLRELLGTSRVELLDTEEAELLSVSLRYALCLPLDQLNDHGALQLYGPGADELPTTPRCTAGGLPVRTVSLLSDPQLRIRLTPLGRWGMREALLADGADVPRATPDVACPDVAEIVDLGAVEVPPSVANSR